MTITTPPSSSPYAEAIEEDCVRAMSPEFLANRSEPHPANIRIQPCALTAATLLKTAAVTVTFYTLTCVVVYLAANGSGGGTGRENAVSHMSVHTVTLPFPLLLCPLGSVLDGVLGGSSQGIKVCDQCYMTHL